MSLVQPFPRNMRARSTDERRIEPSIIDNAISEANSIQQLVVSESEGQDGQQQPVELTARNYQSAFELLDCAAQALEALRDRRDQLEASLKEVSIRAETVISAAQGKASGWQNLVAELKAQNQDMEKRLSVMQQRVEFSESQVDAERIRAEEAGRRAFDAQAVAHGLYVKIMTTFGHGSKARDALLSAWDGRVKQDYSR